MSPPSRIKGHALSGDNSGALALAGYICPVSPRLSERPRRMVIGCLSVQLLRGVAVQMGRFERREDGADPAETCLFCIVSIV